MFSSEQTFTINGHTNKALEKVLQLALDLCGLKSIKAFYEDKNGLVLCSYKCSGSTEYPFEVTIPVLVEQINQYIKNLSNPIPNPLCGTLPYFLKSKYHI